MAGIVDGRARTKMFQMDGSRVVAAQVRSIRGYGQANGVANHWTDRNLILQEENSGVSKSRWHCVSYVVVEVHRPSLAKAHGRSTEEHARLWCQVCGTGAKHTK